MKLRFLGVRGSKPTHKRQLLGYGGNSTCLELLLPDEDFHLFIDGGSGLVPRGQELTDMPKRKRFHFLVTHTHWDHVLGYPFFKPIYSPRNELNFYASSTTRSSFHELFFGLHRTANLPVPVQQLKAKLAFRTIAPKRPFTIENTVRVNTIQLNHQGVTLGYRVEHHGASMCLITDHAPLDGGNYLGEGMADQAAANPLDFERRFHDGMLSFLRGVHTVVFDTHFTEQNLKADWGHSTPQRALEICRQAGVKRLILFHHAPEDMDEQVDDKVQSIFHDACQYGIETEAAREGDEWDLSA